MTSKQFKSKTKSLAKMRKKHKSHVIFDDSAVRINLIKEIIKKLESEIEAYKLNNGIH